MNLVRFFFLIAVAAIIWQACKHYPTIEPLDPGDTTTNPIDTTTNPGDTTTNPIDTSGVPCDPNTVYFVNDIIPLLTYCTMPGQNPGCHNADDHADGIVFAGATNQQTYNNVMNHGDVDPGNPGNSEIYEVLIEPLNDQDHMPPPGVAQLSTAQINMIRDWIDQGAQFNECNENYGNPLGCDTTNITYEPHIKAIIQSNCIGCHNATVASDNINLSTHQGVKNSQLNNARLFGAVNHISGYTPMPYPFPTKPKLPDCDVKKINAWINAGMP